MILRKIQLWTYFLTFQLLATVTAQNARSYDENDWIPITPSNAPDNTKKAQERVLNLNAPSQNYFPENEYLGKRAQPQYAQETSFQKVRLPKAETPYKFEPVLPLQPPQYIPQNQFIQQPQFVPPLQQIPYVQTLQQVQQTRPIPEQNLNQQLVAPPQNTQNYYDADKRPFSPRINSSFLQPANVLPLNQDLLEAIQRQNFNQIPSATTTKPKEEKESVQLLYVPLENLQTNQPVTQQTPRITKQTQAPSRREKQINRQQNKFDQLTNIQDDFIAQALAAHKLQQQLKLGEPVLFQEPTTTTTPQPRTKKPKPNQPPLAVYMEKTGNAEIKDVLEILKQAKTISVQDNVGPGSPKVFVGPSSIDPEGYAKFPLPYLSSVQGNRIERKVEQLPFFVAPLSYKTPEGYSKIPLPSPHVGSVVVSTKQQLHAKSSELKQPQTAQNQIVQDFDVKQPFSTYKENSDANSYLLNRNNVPTSQNTLLGFENDFVGFNSPPSYEVSSSKGFTNDYETAPKENYDAYDGNPNYQLGLRDSSQFYESTPSYRTTERSRTTYKIPDYPTTEREIPAQNSKELIRDYDIPSLPVETKTSFAPNYQTEQKQQINDFATSIRQNSPANTYRISEAPIRTSTTTTTESVPITPKNQFKLAQRPESQYTSREVPYDPFTQVINQYEIEQINSQFREEKTERVPPTRTTTPAPVTTKKYVDYDTPSPTVRTRSRSRQRGRTTAARTTTTAKALPEENYTILEEFSVEPKTSTVKYTTEVETIPAKVYRLGESPAPVFVQTQAPLNQQTLNQEILDQQILRANPQSKQNEQQFLVESSPRRPSADVSQQFGYTRPNADFNYNAPSRQNYNKDILENTATVKPDLNQAIAGNAPSRDSGETERASGEVQNARLTPLVFNRGQESSEEEAPVSSYIPGLINNLQDQAVRPLLIPSLLVPTTERVSTVSQQGSTEEIQEIRVSTTTEAPKIETTTQRRTRGRQRAQSKYTSTASPRRTVNRRRQNHTRPTTEKQLVRTTEAPEYEPTRRTTNQRQRFRTRGRPAQREQQPTERVVKPAETAFRQPPLEGGFRESSGDPDSYGQFQQVVDNQQVITVKPEQSSEEAPIREYHQVYSLPQQASSVEVKSEDAGLISKPTVEIKTASPVSERTREPLIVTTPSEDSKYRRVSNNVQSGSYSPSEETSSKAPVRARIRARTRGRFSSTTPRVPTTKTFATTEAPKSQEETEQEFYGFIREPEFNKPQPVVETTQQPIALYSASYKQTPRTLIQMVDDEIATQDVGASNTPAPVFIGQIRPKYTTTEAQEPSTKAPKIRQRARIRIPNRKVTSQQQQAYNEVNSQKLDDQVTRRSSIVRTRSRGKNHFRLPENVSARSKDENLEGQNYPISFLKSREASTEKAESFQISVNPSDEETDQQPLSSLYSPQIIKNTGTQWVEATVLPGPNALETGDKQYFATNSEEQTTEPIEADSENEEIEVHTESTDEELPTTTAFVDTTTQKRRKVGRRRGVWKLVQHRPIESFESAESQNYYSVLNSFESLEKKKNDENLNKKVVTKTTLKSAEETTTTTPAPVTVRKVKRPITTTTEMSIFDTLYNMLGLASKASQLQPSSTKIVIGKEPQIQKEVTTTTNSPTFPEEITVETTTQEIKLTEDNYKEETTFIPETTIIVTTTTTPPLTTITPTTEAAVKNYNAEPLKVHEVKTSTTTEVSHETEICYKGKCVKSKDEDTRL